MSANPQVMAKLEIFIHAVQEILLEVEEFDGVALLEVHVRQNEKTQDSRNDDIYILSDTI